MSDPQAHLAAVCRGETAPANAREALYRRLVLGNLRGVVRGVLPRTREALERLGRFEDDLQAFLRERGPRTAHVRDVPHEWARFSTDAWVDAGLTWIAEIARFECTDFRLGYQPREEAIARGEMALDAQLALRGPLALEHFTYAVQADEQPPPLDPQVLLWYRDSLEEPRTLRLTPMAAALLREVMRGRSLQDALISAAAECALALDEATLTSTARFLDDLIERGIVLGRL